MYFSWIFNTYNQNGAWKYWKVFKYAITLIHADKGGKKTWTYFSTKFSTIHAPLTIATIAIVVNLHLSDTVFNNIQSFIKIWTLTGMFKCFVFDYRCVPVQVCFQSLEYKPNMEKQRSVIMRHIPGTNSLKTAAPLWLSSLLNQDWRPLCLPSPFTEDCSFYSPVLSLLNLFYWAYFPISYLVLRYCVLMSSYLFLNVSEMQFFLFSFDVIYAPAKHI